MKQFKKWEPWMGEAAKVYYERGKPEIFNAMLRRKERVTKNMIVCGKSDGLYKILEIKEVIDEGLFIRIIGRWQQLSSVEQSNAMNEDKVNYIF